MILQLIQRVGQHVDQDLQRCIREAVGTEVHGDLLQTRNECQKALSGIESRARTGLLRPNLPLRLENDASEEFWSEDSGQQRQRIGWFGISGNPTHWVHVTQCLRAIADHDGPHCVVLQVLGNSPHKVDEKIDKCHRHEIARRAVADLFPLIRYTPLGYDNRKFGEDNAAELLLLNYHNPIELNVISAGDTPEISAQLIEASRVTLQLLRSKHERAIDPRPEELLPDLRGLVIVGEEPSPELQQLLTDHPFLSRIGDGLPSLNIDATRFRKKPWLPLMPWSAFEYIHDHGLYGTDRPIPQP